MDQELQSTRRRWWMLAAALVAVTLVTATAACGDDDDDSSSDTTAADESSDGGGTGAADATLDVTEFQYTDVTVPAGGTLEVVNTSGGAHTFTADDGAFDDELGDGQTITVDVPTEPGEYPYHCEIHPSMVATLTAE